MTIKEFLLTKECEGYPSAWHAYVYNSIECSGVVQHSVIGAAFNFENTNQGHKFWDDLNKEYEELKNKPKKRNLVELFHTYGVEGVISLCDKDGGYLSLIDKKFYDYDEKYMELYKKNIIKDMPSRWLDLDTWELVEKDDE